MLERCLAAAGFSDDLDDEGAAEGESRTFEAMDVDGGTERDTIPGVVSVRGVISMLILVAIALGLAFGISKRLERAMMERGAGNLSGGSRGYSVIEREIEAELGLSSGDEAPRTPPLRDNKTSSFVGDEPASGGGGGVDYR